MYSVDAARWGRTLRRPLQHVDVYLTAFRAPGQKATRVFRAADLPSQLPLNLTLFSMLSGDDVLRSAALPNPFTESMPSMARLVIVLYSEQYMQIYCKYSMYADNNQIRREEKPGKAWSTANLTYATAYRYGGLRKACPGRLIHVRSSLMISLIMSVAARAELLRAHVQLLVRQSALVKRALAKELKLAWQPPTAPIHKHTAARARRRKRRKRLYNHFWTRGSSGRQAENIKVALQVRRED